MEELKTKAAALFRQRQTEICEALESEDGKSKFINDSWERKDPKASYGGGGVSRIISNGAVFEKAGVNFSEVSGNLPTTLVEKMTGAKDRTDFFATGVSLVVHPYSPNIPTTHANFRYLEVAGKAWFGGGADLTPYYLFDQDAIHFHQVLKDVCDKHDPKYYPEFKAWCDKYFFLPHRGEARGIGGIFYDYLGKEEPDNLEKNYQFSADISNAFINCYLPIVKKRKESDFTKEQKNFQLQRRGRYVEFNLLYDRGTQFGLQSGGRTESILMSMPPQVHWEYNFTPDENTEEAKLVETLKNPKNWLS